MHVLCENKLGTLGLLLSDALEEAQVTLSRSAAALLLTLFYREHKTVAAMAKVLGVSQPTVTRLMDGLVRQGFVERTGRAGRIALVRLTPAGLRKARLLQDARLNAMKDLLRVLSRREQRAFEHTLDKLLAGATRSRAFARTVCRLCNHAICTGPLCPIGTQATQLERASKA
jgi:DNA-binding MarR family transcriptional regulator